MAARATRSASRAAGSSDAASRCLLLALSHDELGVIFDGLADPLQPVVAVALSRTCLGLRTPLRAALEVLKERHGRANALCRKIGSTSRPFEAWIRGTTCSRLRDAVRLHCGPDTVGRGSAGLTADETATLGMILCKLPELKTIFVHDVTFDGAGMNSLCECFRRVCLPSLKNLSLTRCSLGPTVAEALAAAIRRGALPNLETLGLGGNFLGAQGAAALATPLRTLPRLHSLHLWSNNIGDKGVASLLDKLGKDDFKALERLSIASNNITDVGCAAIVASLDADAMPLLQFIPVTGEGGSQQTQQARNAVSDALARAKGRRGAAG